MGFLTQYYLLHNIHTNETVIHDGLTDLMFEDGFRIVTKVSNSRVNVFQHNVLRDRLFKEQYHG